VVWLGIIYPENTLWTTVHQNQIDLLADLFIGLLPGDRFKFISNPF